MTRRPRVAPRQQRGGGGGRAAQLLWLLGVPFGRFRSFYKQMEIWMHETTDFRFAIRTSPPLLRGVELRNGSSRHAVTALDVSDEGSGPV
jgi:hypothetical protein